MITYVEFLAENISDILDFSEFLSEDFNKNIGYSEYIAKSLQGVSGSSGKIGVQGISGSCGNIGVQGISGSCGNSGISNINNRIYPTNNYSNEINRMIKLTTSGTTFVNNNLPLMLEDFEIILKDE